MDMLLAKSDMAIGARYAALVKDEALRDSVFSRIAQEHAAPLQSLLAITGQQELLHRYRDGASDSPVTHGIHLSINGIAAGLRNSG